MMIRLNAVRAIFGVICGMLFAACGGATCVSGPSPASQVVGPQLVYPIPGATGVSPNVGIVAYTNPYAGDMVNVYLEASSGTIPAGVPEPAPSPLPSPHAPPPFAPPFASIVPVLSAASMYSVVYVSPALSHTEPCTNVTTPGQVILGSFSTK